MKKDETYNSLPKVQTLTLTIINESAEDMEISNIMQKNIQIND